jgi:hypothetical protein
MVTRQPGSQPRTCLPLNDTLSLLLLLLLLPCALQLRLLVSNTPRKGSCPIYFSDNMSTNLQQLESITIEGPLLPYVALQVRPGHNPCAADACMLAAGVASLAYR